MLSADSCQALFNSIQPSCYGSLVTFVNAYCVSSNLVLSHRSFSSIIILNNLFIAGSF